MITSESIDQLALALTAAQSEIVAAPKDKINPHFKSKYADLSSVWDACRPSLGKQGLAVIQCPSITADRLLRITTRILHKSGQWIESSLDLKPTQDTPQAMGSAITYARRYSLSAMVGVVADEDDDGHHATKPAAIIRKHEYRSEYPKNLEPNDIYTGNEQQKPFLKVIFSKYKVAPESMKEIATKLATRNITMAQLEDVFVEEFHSKENEQ